MRIKQFYVFLYCIVLMSVCNAVAQQDAQYTQYMYNTIAINPAYAGSRGVTSAFVLHRNQWVGFDGAPITNVFSVHKPISNTELGYGISVVNDQIGISDNNTISIDVSYSIPVSEISKVSFGIKSSANWLSVNYSRLIIRNPNDIVLSQQNEIENQFSPNIGLGIYWHTPKNYIGISMPNLLQTQRYNDNISAASQDKVHLYFIAGTVFDVSSDWKFKPALLTKLTQGSPLQIDASANFLFNEKFTLGLGYRFKAAVTGLVGFQVNPALHIGYAYDTDATKLANYNSGSHELFLRFELFSRYNKIVAPRFF